MITAVLPFYFSLDHTSADTISNMTFFMTISTSLFQVCGKAPFLRARFLHIINKTVFFNINLQTPSIRLLHFHQVASFRSVHTGGGFVDVPIHTRSTSSGHIGLFTITLSLFTTLILHFSSPLFVPGTIYSFRQATTDGFGSSLLL